MITINFNINTRADSKRGKPVSIVGVIRYEGKRVKIGLGKSVLIAPKDWNKSRQRAKGGDKFFINESLSKFTETVKGEYKRLFKENKGAPTPATLKLAVIDKLNGRTTKRKEKGLRDFFGEFIKMQKSKVSENTLKSYVTVKNIIGAMENKLGKEYPLSKIDFNFLNDFQGYLLEQGKAPSYVHRNFKIVKTVLGKADMMGEDIDPVYLKRQFKADTSPPQDFIYLNESELAALYKLELEKDSGNDHVRDAFLIAAFTGLRFSDFSKLKERGSITEKDGYKMLNITTQKTGKRVSVPLDPLVLAILAKRNGDVPRAYTQQAFNRKIKRVAEKAGINKEVTQTKYKGAERITTRHKKWELVSTHTCRRSFATNKILAGIPHPTVMALTGHTQLTSFMKYIRLSSEEAADYVARHPSFGAISPLKVAK